MKPTYDEWLCEVCKCLAHPVAITCVFDASTLAAWHQYGAHPQRAANVLNERWRSGLYVAQMPVKEQVAV